MCLHGRIHAGTRRRPMEFVRENYIFLVVMPEEEKKFGSERYAEVCGPEFSADFYPCSERTTFYCSVLCR